MTKKITLFLAVLVILIMPLTASAADFRSGEEATLAKDQTIRDDLYLSYGEVVISSIIKGDLSVWGGKITIDGQVTGDLTTVGGEIELSGRVDDDVRIAGGNILISGTIGDDLFIGGGNVEIAEDAVVEGSVLVGAGQLIIAGTTGPVKAGIGSLTVRSTAQINGDLLYVSEDEAQIKDGAKITGETIHRVSEAGAKGFGATLVVNKLISLLSIVILALLLVYFFSGLSTLLADRWKERFGISLLWGLLALILIPIAGFILMLTIVGAPVAIGFFLIYPVLLYLAKIVGIVGVGLCIQRLWDKKQKQPDWLSVIVGAVVFYIIALIPWIGWLGTLIITLVGLGVVIIYAKDLFNSLKSRGKTA